MGPHGAAAQKQVINCCSASLFRDIEPNIKFRHRLFSIISNSTIRKKVKASKAAYFPPEMR